jgi:predicted pyridoxine 5'-phosphate oxidase superfamily flavin-nucleotide-binding protein
MEAKMSELRANYSEAKASASRKAAMAELKDAEADYKEKLAALGSATADTWDSAKQNVIASWDKLQAKYDKARAD